MEKFEYLVLAKLVDMIPAWGIFVLGIIFMIYHFITTYLRNSLKRENVAASSNTADSKPVILILNLGNMNIINGTEISDSAHIYENKPKSRPCSKSKVKKS